jgi:hypothetical protein
MSTAPRDPSMIPVDVNGQTRLFDGELTAERARELLADLKLKANRAGLFVESSDPITPWP